MNDLFYIELREKNREIRTFEQTGSPDEIREWQDQTIEMLETLVQLSIVARNEGLLALESAADALDESLFYGEALKELVYPVTDGISLTIVEEIGMQRYFAGDMKGYQGLNYLLLLKGMSAISQNENPWIVEWKLRTMLPAELDQIYCQRKQERKEEKIKEEPDLSKVTEVCQGIYTGEITGVGAAPVKYLDEVISKVSDRDLQRLLRELENSVLKVALKGLGREAREHVFHNMSKRLAVMIAEEMISEGFAEESEIILASQKIIGIWQRLVEEGEVANG